MSKDIDKVLDRSAETHSPWLIVIVALFLVIIDFLVFYLLGVLKI